MLLKSQKPYSEINSSPQHCVCAREVLEWNDEKFYTVHVYTEKSNQWDEGFSDKAFLAYSYINVNVWKNSSLCNDNDNSSNGNSKKCLCTIVCGSYILILGYAC